MTKFDIFTKSFLFKTCWETLYCTKGFLGESPKGIWRHIPSDRKRAAINVGHGRVDQGIVSNKIRYQIIMIVSRYFSQFSYQRQKNRVQGKLATTKPDCKGQSWRKKWPLDRMSPPQRLFWRKPCKWQNQLRRPQKWLHRLGSEFARFHPCMPIEQFL